MYVRVRATDRTKPSSSSQEIAAAAAVALAEKEEEEEEEEKHDCRRRFLVDQTKRKVFYFIFRYLFSTSYQISFSKTNISRSRSLFRVE